MPTYEYRCDNCGNKEELFEKITAEPSKHCSKCEQESLRRLPSCGIGLSFQGSGFYITDYKSKNNKEASSSPSIKTETTNSSSTLSS